MAALNAYIDVSDFAAMGPGMSLQPYCRGNTVLTAPATQNANSLTVAQNKGFPANSPLWILDGANSEMVYTAATAPEGGTDGATTINLATGLQFAHGAYVCVASGGSRGSLPQLLIRASAWVENYCEQGSEVDRSLWGKQRTSRYKLPTMRAFINPQYSLVIRPNNFPVTAVSSISVEFAPGNALGFDATQVELDDDGRLITLPILSQTTAQVQSPAWLYGPPLTREDEAWAVIIYTAGIGGVVGALPEDFKLAVAWVARELLGETRNPTGAASMRQEDVTVNQRHTNARLMESSADSIFLIQAKEALRRYKQRPF